jgi:hypothetical protein
MNLIILGPMNSGTNLLKKILENSGCFLLDNSNTQIFPVGDGSIIWKHNFDFQQIETLLQDPNNLVIFMYKNVFNWLFSMKKKSYEIEFKTIDGEAKFHGIWNGELYATNFIVPNKQTFTNIIQLYNIYYTNYRNCLMKYNNVIFLDYEKIIDKVNCFQYINNKLKKIQLRIISEDSLLKVLSQPSKEHGHSVKNSDEAYLNYSNNQILVKNFIYQRPQLYKFISNNIIFFYENSAR